MVETNLTVVTVVLGDSIPHFAGPLIGVLDQSTEMVTMLVVVRWIWWSGNNPGTGGAHWWWWCCSRFGVEPLRRDLDLPTVEVVVVVDQDSCFQRSRTW